MLRRGLENKLAEASNEPPMESADIIVLHGDDELSIQEKIVRIVNSNDSFADLNTTRLDGADTNFTDISTQLNMLPMGAEKRVVILDHADELLKLKDAQKWLESLLTHFPPTTRMVLILADEKKYLKGQIDWIRFKGSHWLRKMLQSFSGVYSWSELQLPDEKKMPGWIEEKAIELGGSFQPGAAQALANLVGSDLYQAKHEIEKAIAYAGEGNQVSSADVRLLCTASKEENIFALVDAVGMRDVKTATRLYQELILEMPAQYILSMLVRQIRLILQASIVLENRGSAKDVVEVSDVKSEWQAQKLINQAKRFNLQELEMIYRKLDQIDEDSKIGRISIEGAIEPMLVAITSK